MEKMMRVLWPVTLGPYSLRSRIVMAPMTRNRAGARGVPSPINAIYYSQRASAGLIITEATQISPQGVGYPSTPGIHSSEQTTGWRLVTDAVHRAGGRIFLQLWHAGRVSHPLTQGGALPIAPSPIAPEGEIVTTEGPKAFVTPRALKTEEIPGIVEQFRRGAKNALVAGFDGIEIHSANGYLLDQFLQDGTNKRTDRYGGSLENRARLLLDVTNAVVDIWGSNRVGIRISPGGTFNSMHDSDPAATFGHVAQELNTFGLAYLHVVEPNPPDEFKVNDSRASATRYLRSIFKGTLITAQGYDRDRANAVLAAGDADLVAFAKLFIANPDLPARFALDAPLNTPDPKSFYGGDERGYTDYPGLELQEASVTSQRYKKSDLVRKKDFSPSDPPSAQRLKISC